MDFVFPATDTIPCQQKDSEIAATSPTLTGRITLYLVCLINQLCKQWKNFTMFTEAHVNARRVGRIRKKYTNPRRSQGFGNSVEFS